MRPAELAFLLLLTAYHAVLLVPRHRRPFPANYLVFLAGMALAWNLGMEGLRWQTIPPLGLFLVDLMVLFPTLATLRGRLPRPGWVPVLGHTLRTVVASFALLGALASAVLAVAFPVPEVALTGGLSPSFRVVRFPPTAELPGLELKIWYPAAGDTRPEPRPQAEPQGWARVQDRGGLPAFWSSYLSELPSSLVRGGKLASSGNRYPVVLVALPPGQDAEDFGYLFEDLASRGLLVAAGGPIPGPAAPQEAFSWRNALANLLEPLGRPELWVEPDRNLGLSGIPTDYSWLGPTQRALEQLDSEPGDLLFSAVDGKHQVLWAWGPGPGLGSVELARLRLRGQVHVGGAPAARPAARPELWIQGGPVVAPPQPGQWFLSLPQLHRADVSDSAYLRPYLAFVGLKSQADAGVHGALRQYFAAFCQYTLWGSGGEVAFGQTVPEVPGLVLSGQ